MILYYYHKAGCAVGPVTLAELRDKLTAGELTEQSLACPSGAQQWESVRTVLAKAPLEEPSLPPLTSPRVIAKALTGAVRDVRERMNGTSLSMPREEESQFIKETAEEESSSITLDGAWKAFGILGVVVATVALFALSEYSISMRIVGLIVSLLDLLICLTMSQACKALKAYLKNAS